jgi:hypothetical protein
VFQQRIASTNHLPSPPENSEALFYYLSYATGLFLGVGDAFMIPVRAGKVKLGNVWSWFSQGPTVSTLASLFAALP